MYSVRSTCLLGSQVAALPTRSGPAVTPLRQVHGCSTRSDRAAPLRLVLLLLHSVRSYSCSARSGCTAGPLRQVALLLHFTRFYSCSFRSGRPASPLGLVICCLTQAGQTAAPILPVLLPLHSARSLSCSPPAGHTAAPLLHVALLYSVRSYCFSTRSGR